MVKHIGIVACSAEGAALCYRTICQVAELVLGMHNHPEITMHTYPLKEYMKYIEIDDWESVGRLMLESTKKLAQVGADFVICPDNTIHKAFKYVNEKSPVPWLHIVEEVGKQAKLLNYNCLGILGTKYTMEGSIYSDVLTRMGIEMKIPTMEQRSKVNEIIFEELVHGNFLSSSRLYFEEVIGQLKSNGCDAAVLGCTEIPLLIDPETSPLPTLDSTRILARAALKNAIEN